MCAGGTFSAAGAQRVKELIPLEGRRQGGEEGMVEGFSDRVLREREGPAMQRRWWVLARRF